MKLVYVCGPYGAPTPEEIEENVRRACALSLLAAELGYAPQVVHAGIHRNAYGSDADAATRRRGLEIDFAWIDATCRCGGELWVLLKTVSSDVLRGPAGEAVDVHALSAGSREEVELFLAWPGEDARPGQMLSRIRWFGWHEGQNEPIEIPMPPGLL